MYKLFETIKGLLVRVLSIFRPPKELEIEIAPHNDNLIDLSELIDDKKIFTSYYPQAVFKGYNSETGKYYQYNYPKGAVVHYSASPDNPYNLLEFMRSKKICSFIIDRSGKVWQDFPIEQWGYHAGKSKWRKSRGTTVNDEFVGIELISAGKLNPKKLGDNVVYKTWWEGSIPSTEVRYSPKKKNIIEGHYHIFTKEQEESLMDLLFWLYQNNPVVFNLKNICGHDECSPGRKTDPGASLSITMDDLRKKIYDKSTSFKFH